MATAMFCEYLLAPLLMPATLTGVLALVTSTSARLARAHSQHRHAGSSRVDRVDRLKGVLKAV